MSKNAIAARENRIRKKMYLDKLERNVRALTTENGKLRSRNNQLMATVDDLTEEVRYLKSILSNVDEISALIRGVRATKPDVSVGVSLAEQKAERVHKRRRINEEHDYDVPPVARTTVSDTDGICLHVARGKVSLEFCHRCSSHTKSSTLDCVEQFDDGR